MEILLSDTHFIVYVILINHDERWIVSYIELSLHWHLVNINPGNSQKL